VLGPEYRLIERTLPCGSSRSKSPETVLLTFRDRVGLEILDLGCGDGRAVELLAKFDSPRYTGVDIEASPEVGSRTRTDADFQTYDGQNLPFPDRTFDIVYSRQVFEHIRHPDNVAAEVLRVLKPGGSFVGSLSYLEPYHSFSIFNTTPYGVFRLLEDNGFVLRSMWPGVEGMSLFVRQLTNRRINQFSFVYPLIEIAGRLARWDHRKRNYLKLRFAGHITFLAERPVTASKRG
jgi:SAM-dependent methyltransferase